MNLSMRWLGDYVTIDTTPHDYAEKMTAMQSVCSRADQLTGYKTTGL